MFQHHAQDIAAGMAWLTPARLLALGDLLGKLGMAVAPDTNARCLTKPCRAT
jgi:hypothetical protein